MKFFTKDLRTPHPGSYQYFRSVRARYREQLETLRPLLSADTFLFFSGDELHDGELLDLQILAGSRPAPLHESPRPWKTPLNRPCEGSFVGAR